MFRVTQIRNIKEKESDRVCFRMFRVFECFGIDKLYVHGYGDNDRECFEFFEYKVFFEYKMLGIVLRVKYSPLILSLPFQLN